MPAPSVAAKDWSSNLNHPAGGAGWNNQPTKVEPNVGVTAAGFQPAAPFPVETLNWLLNNHGAWIRYFQNERIDAASLDIIRQALNVQQLGNWQVSEDAATPLMGGLFGGDIWVSDFSGRAYSHSLGVDGPIKIVYAEPMIYESTTWQNPLSLPGNWHQTLQFGETLGGGFQGRIFAVGGRNGVGDDHIMRCITPYEEMNFAAVATPAGANQDTPHTAIAWNPSTNRHIVARTGELLEGTPAGTFTVLGAYSGTPVGAATVVRGQIAVSRTGTICYLVTDAGGTYIARGVAVGANRTNPNAGDSFDAIYYDPYRDTFFVIGRNTGGGYAVTYTSTNQGVTWVRHQHNTGIGPSVTSQWQNKITGNRLGVVMRTGADPLGAGTIKYERAMVLGPNPDFTTPDGVQWIKLQDLFNFQSIGYGGGRFVGWHTDQTGTSGTHLAWSHKITQTLEARAFANNDLGTRLAALWGSF